MLLKNVICLMCGINVPSDACNSCGYQGLIDGNCPKCGSSDIQRLRRITGYLSTTYEHFNTGKKQETEMRVKHNGRDRNIKCGSHLLQSLNGWVAGQSTRQKRCRHPHLLGKFLLLHFSDFEQLFNITR